MKLIGLVSNDNSGFDKTGYNDELFIFVNDVYQVFYVKDMCSKFKRNSEEIWELKCYIVFSGKRKIVGVEDKTD